MVPEDLVREREGRGEEGLGGVGPLVLHSEALSPQVDLRLRPTNQGT